jgi:hypothetical protein
MKTLTNQVDHLLMLVEPLMKSRFQGIPASKLVELRSLYESMNKNIKWIFNAEQNKQIDVLRERFTKLYNTVINYINAYQTSGGGLSGGSMMSTVNPYLSTPKKRITNERYYL